MSTARTRRWSEGGGEAELGEDAGDVLLDGALGDDQAVGDGGVAAALGHQGEDVELAGAEGGQGVGAAAAEELGHHLGVDGGAAVADPADGGQELADVGDPVLEQVADALGAPPASRWRSVPRRTGTAPGWRSRGPVRGPPGRPAGPRRCGSGACGRRPRPGRGGRPRRPRPGRDRRRPGRRPRPRRRPAAGPGPRGAGRSPRRSRPARQLRPDHRRAAGRAGDGEAAVDGRHPVGQAAQAAALGRVGPAGAVVGDLDDQEVPVAADADGDLGRPACLAALVRASATTK